MSKLSDLGRMSFINAESILDGARKCLARYDCDLAVRRSQQSFELYLKTLCRLLQLQNPETHDLKKQIYDLSAALAEFNISKQQAFSFRVLKGQRLQAQSEECRVTPSELPTRPLRRVENTIQQLLNDMRTVVEARCRLHGSAGGTTANSAAALLPCIGVEMVAQRTTTEESRDESIRRVFREVGELTGYERYGRVGFALFKLCRNGLAHGFYPNDVELANGPKGGVAVTFWIDAETQRSFCVEEVGGRAESGHLAHWNLGGEHVLLKMSAQHLYLDVKAYLENFLVRLQSDSTLQAVVEENDQRLLQSATKAATEALEDRDFIALAM